MGIGRGSGTIEFVGGMVRYRSEAYGQWSVPLDEIRVIGEATNENGPFADDYFLCFARDAGGWHEASFYAAGRDRC